MSLKKRGKHFHYYFCVRGKRYRGTTGQTVESKALKVQSLMMQQANDRGVIPMLGRSQTLGEMSVRFIEWLDGTRLEKKTKLYYKNGYRLLKQTRIIYMRLDAITADEIDALKFDGSPANTNNALRTVRRMLSKAKDWGLIGLLPSVKLAKEYGREMMIGPTEEAALLAVATQPLADVLTIIDDTGMRPCEIFRMRREHINWEMRVYFNTHGKSGKARRYIPISDRMMEILVKREAKAASPWVFPSKRSASGHITTVAKQFESAREAAGLSDKLVLYCGKHWFCTDTLKRTGNVFALMDVVGHNDVKHTMQYQHQGIEQIRDVVNERHKSRHSVIVTQ